MRRESDHYCTTLIMIDMETSGQARSTVSWRALGRVAGPRAFCEEFLARCEDGLWGCIAMRIDGRDA